MKSVELRTERLLLDQPGERDIDAIAEFCADPLFERFMTLPWPYTRADAEQFVRESVPNWWGSEKEATWAIRTLDEPERLIGVIGVRRARSDIGFWLGAPHRGHEYMVEAVDRVLEWIHDSRFTELATTGWSCFEGNLASAAIARKTGFRFQGTGPSPIPQRDGTRPPSWLAVHRWGSEDHTDSWPPFTRA